MKKEVIKDNKNKEKKDIDKTLLIILTVLLVITIILIPLLYIAEVKKLLPIVFFIILPIIFGGLVLLLARNCLFEYKNKKNAIINKISK